MKVWKAQLGAKLREWAEAPAKFVPAAAVVVVAVAALLTAVKYFRRLAGRSVRRAREDDPRVRRFRERAGRALVRIDRSAASGRRVDDAVRAAVEKVRFGAPGDWPDPVATLDAVGPAISRAKRQ